MRGSVSLADDAGVTANPWEKIARRKQRPAERRELTTEELRRVVQTAEGEMRLLYALGVPAQILARWYRARKGAS